MISISVKPRCVCPPAWRAYRVRVSLGTRHHAFTLATKNGKHLLFSAPTCRHETVRLASHRAVARRSRSTRRDARCRGRTRAVSLWAARVLSAADAPVAAPAPPPAPIDVAAGARLFVRNPTTAAMPSSCSACSRSMRAVRPRSSASAATRRASCRSARRSAKPQNWPRFAHARSSSTVTRAASRDRAARRGGNAYVR